MGTRSLIYIYDGEQRVKNIVVNIYQQYDGYPSGVGAELAEFLSGRDIINGIPIGKDLNKASNGMGCLAASVVAAFKVGIGGTYLNTISSKKGFVDYQYHVYLDGDYYKGTHKLMVRVKNDSNHTIFNGDVEAFTKFCKGG